MPVMEGVSATVAGREFHKGIVRGKMLNLKEHVDGKNCLNLLEWPALVHAVDGVK